MPTVGNFAYCISVVTPRGRLLRRRHRRRSRDSCDRSSMCVARLTTWRSAANAPDGIQISR
jgi:hypothetical protein